MDGERISLRLTSLELEMMDDFIIESERFDNRSQLARTAIRGYVEGYQVGPVTDDESLQEIELPPFLNEVLLELVDQGEFGTITSAVEYAVRRMFVEEEGYLKASRGMRDVRFARYKMVPK